MYTKSHIFSQQFRPHPMCNDAPRNKVPETQDSIYNYTGLEFCDTAPKAQQRRTRHVNLGTKFPRKGMKDCHNGCHWKQRVGEFKIKQ